MSERSVRRVLVAFLVALALWVVTSIVDAFGYGGTRLADRLTAIGLYVGLGALLVLLAQTLVAGISYFRRKG